MSSSNAKRNRARPKTSSRRPCRLCHNLDPRGHPQSVCPDPNTKIAATSLTLVVDGLELQRIQSKGCRFCHVIVQALDGFCKEWKKSRGRVVLEMVEKGPVKITLDDSTLGEVSVELSASSAKRTPWPTLGRVHPIPSNAGSDQTFDFARNAIQHCLTNAEHINCRSTASNIVPRRLLDVGRVNQPIRIVDTQQKRFQYATLSHCWGTGPTLTTTKANWQRISSNIPFDALPALFQDAIIITRQLGIRYLWIDSLCIIQDSQRDWETESAKMGGIYENSYVTIAATMSGNGTTRCLVDRLKPLRISYENSRKEEFAIRARKALDHHPDGSEDKPARPRGPLSTRAWALQEHVLSTRILHYTSTELLFECRTSFRCECTKPKKRQPTTPSLIPKAIASKGKDQYRMWHAWQQVVCQYSKRAITVPADELPAISGIASKIYSATSSTYLAGLWVGNLASDLLWSTDPNDKSVLELTSPDPWRAPTFSWASIKARVMYYDPDEDERAKFKSQIAIRAAGCKISSLNPLGTVSDGLILLEGPVLEVILVAEETVASGMSYQLLIKGTSAIPITPDCLLVQDGETARRARLEEPRSAFKANVLCLAVASYDSWISGIVLGLSQRVPEAYERLGAFAAGGEVFRKAEKRTLKLV